jgi:hypothetical protein
MFQYIFYKTASFTTLQDITCPEKVNHTHHIKSLFDISLLYSQNIRNLKEPIIVPKKYTSTQKYCALILPVCEILILKEINLPNRSSSTWWNTVRKDHFSFTFCNIELHNPPRRGQIFFPHSLQLSGLFRRCGGGEFSHIQSTHLLTLYIHSDMSITHGKMAVYDFSKVIS